MALELSDVFEVCQRSLFEALRLALVETEYLPDITSFNPDAAGYAAWEAAVLEVVTQKGFCIELFGVGSPESKYIKKIPRIVLKTGRALPGDLGNSPEPLVQKLGEDTNYTKFRVAPTTTDYEMEVHCVFKTAAQERIVMGIIGAVLAKRAYINLYDAPEDEQKLFIQFISHIDYSDPTEGYSEHVYTYKFKDLYEAPDKVISTGIKPINEITVEIKDDARLGNQDLTTDIIT